MVIPSPFQNPHPPRKGASSASWVPAGFTALHTRPGGWAFALKRRLGGRSGGGVGGARGGARKPPRFPSTSGLGGGGALGRSGESPRRLESLPASALSSSPHPKRGAGGAAQPAGALRVGAVSEPGGRRWAARDPGSPRPRAH